MDYAKEGSTTRPDDPPSKARRRAAPGSLADRSQPGPDPPLELVSGYGADNGVADPAPAVDDHRGRRARHAVAPHRDGHLVDADRVGDAGAAHGVGGHEIQFADIDADDGQAVLPVPLMQILQDRHLDEARSAAAGPEVEHDNVALVRRQAQRLAVETDGREVRRGRPARGCLVIVLIRILAVTSRQPQRQAGDGRQQQGATKHGLPPPVRARGLGHWPRRPRPGRAPA